MTFAGIEEEEDANVATILEVLGDLDPEVVRRSLRQHNGNAENALNVRAPPLRTIIFGSSLCVMH